MIFRDLMKRTREYREKYRYSLQWVPSDDNSVFDGLLD